MNEIGFKLFIMFMTLVSVFGVIIYRGFRKSPTEIMDERFADALSYWLQEQISIQLNIPLNHLSQKAKDRINGAARKAVKPLREINNVEIQLPNIVQTPTGINQHFILTISLKDVSHLIPKE